MNKVVKASDGLINADDTKIELDGCVRALVKNTGEATAIINDFDFVLPGDYKAYPYHEGFAYDQTDSLRFQGNGLKQLLITRYYIKDKCE